MKKKKSNQITPNLQTHYKESQSAKYDCNYSLAKFKNKTGVHYFLQDFFLFNYPDKLLWWHEQNGSI